MAVFLLDPHHVTDENGWHDLIRPALLALVVRLLRMNNGCKQDMNRNAANKRMRLP